MHSFITEMIFIYHFHPLFQPSTRTATILKVIFTRLTFESEKKTKDQNFRNKIIFSEIANLILMSSGIWDCLSVLGNVRATNIVFWKRIGLMNVANDNWIGCDIQFSNYNFAVHNKADGIDAFFMLIRSLFPSYTPNSEKMNALGAKRIFKLIGLRL